MNKNLKVISSIAMAGILAATGISTVSAATTKSLGVYRKVVEGKAIVPYVLTSASDTIAVKDLNSEFGVTLSSGTVVKTGTKFNKSNEEHTVVVYGDVNADGRVNVNDVTATAKAVFKTPIDSFVKEAADVAHDGRINVNDVTTLARFIVKKEALNISLPSEEEPETEYDYTLAVNENNIVNSVNAGTTKAVVTPKDAFVDSKAYKVKVLEADGKAETGVEATIPASATLSNEKTATATLDFSSIAEDGIYIVRLELDNKTVGETKIEVHKKNNLKANVVATRIGSNAVTVSAQSIENSNVAKVYYKVKESTAATLDETVKEKSYSITDNVTIQGIGATNQKLTYVLEDTYGNRVSGNLDITNHNVTAVAGTIDKIEADKTANEFKVTLKEANSTATVVATLYNQDGKMLDVAEKAAVSSVATINFATTITNAGVGTYTIKAYVKGTDVAKQSAEVDSATTAENAGKIVVSQLAKVSDIKVDVAKQTITWTDNTNKDVEYTVKVLEPKKVGNNYTGEYKAMDTNIAADKIDSEKKTADFSGVTLDSETSYKVEVVATANPASSRVIDSEKVISEEFFTIEQPTIGTVDTETLEKAVILKNVSKKELAGNSNATIKYEVEVYNVVGNETTRIATKEVTLVADKDDANKSNIVVNGLEVGKDYRFILKVSINGKAAESEMTDITNIAIDSIAISGLTVNNEATSAKQGEIKIYTENGTKKAYINGVTVEDTTKFTTEYQGILNDVVSKLSTGDKVTVNSDAITLDLNGVAGEITLGDAIEGKTITVNGNSYYKTIKMDTKQAEKLVLNKGCLATAAETKAKEVVVNGSTLVTDTNRAYTLKAGVEATMDGIKVKTTNGDGKVTAGSNKLTFDSSANEVEITANKALTVEFKGIDSKNVLQSGKVTVHVKEGGDVTLATTANTSITGNIVTDVEKGSLTITDPGLAGAKTVTVNNVKDATTTVEANLKATAPFTTTAATKVQDILTNYKAETNEFDSAKLTTLTLASEKTAKDVVEFINGLGINADADASIEVTAAGVMTLTFEGNVSNYTMPASYLK